MKTFTDVVIIGGGAAGLMCAYQAAERGLSVVVIEQAKKVGRKILMSGGGKCNFTNMEIAPNKYLSQNPHFCKSALARYTQWDFISLVSEQGIEWEERELGKLFCCHSSKDIVDLLLHHCRRTSVDIRCQHKVKRVQTIDNGFTIHLDGLPELYAKQVVVASGGLSIPSMGASGIGYQIAEQHGHSIIPTRAALVPLTWQNSEKPLFSELSGIATPMTATSENQQSFSEPVLITHRGLSGPAILQISSYWQPGEALKLDWLPSEDVAALVEQWRQSHPATQVSTLLAEYFPKRLARLLCDLTGCGDSRVGDLNKAQLAKLALLNNWPWQPNGSEGYKTAEVTLGGVNTDEVSSKTFESKKQPGLYFIGEVLDVTGWLGGYNFQWAWASAWCCAQALKS
ncbi:BaiN/RdsA family NAD(P)/FAD-dependent oxidoreductase [Salinibius halmophilus]|uniref:NAD(P)/FAD-dependent oxidoreductase n=1 Tax=Salinibius halmophilus TaxID=1853216 RepID=UPI000E669B5C|nr:NAD(P)/FAD-dependent oxidoreductase [Salinibius halmophilus]